VLGWIRAQNMKSTRPEAYNRLAESVLAE